MRKHKICLSLLGFALLLVLAAPGPASAQVDCNQCGPWNYCSEICQWEFFGEYHFSECGLWTTQCISSLKTQEGEQQASLPFFLQPEAPAEETAAQVDPVRVDS